jgi:hypothetical protein
MSYTTLNATGLLLGASGQQRVSLTSDANNVLKVSGTDSSTLAKLRGVDQPADDTDATSRSYVQNYVQSALRGLQTKLAVRLASSVNVGLSSSGQSADPATFRRWAGPLGHGTYNMNSSDFRTQYEEQGRGPQVDFLRADSRRQEMSIGMIFTPSEAHSSGQSGPQLLWIFNGSDYDNFSSSGEPCGIILNCGDPTALIFNLFYTTADHSQHTLSDYSAQNNTYDDIRIRWTDIQAGDKLCFLCTMKRTGQTSGPDWAQCTVSVSIGKLVDNTVTPLADYRNGVTVQTKTLIPPPGFGWSYNQSPSEIWWGLGAMRMYDWSWPGQVSKITVADSVMTLQQAFVTQYLPPPAGFVQSGIDGVTPSANDRVLLTAQTNAVENGLWQVSADGSALQRPVDFATGSHAESVYVFVNGSGASNDNKGFLCSSDGPTIVDTDAQTWQVYTAAGGLGGLSVNGNTISTSSDSVAFANPVAVGSTTVAPAHIADSSGTLTFDSTNIVAPSVSSGTLTATSGSLSDSSGNISMGSTNLSTSGTLTATSYNSPSDANLKYNALPLATTWTDANGTQRSLYDLNPVTFNWNSNGSQDFGVIAQDVEALLQSYVQPAPPAQNGLSSVQAQPKPLQATGTDGTSNVYMTVNYGKLSILCYAMCKDLKNLFSGSGGQGTSLAALIGTPHPGIPPDVGGDLWSAVYFLYNTIGTMNGYIRSLASQITPPPEMLAPGQGFGAFSGEANLPHLAGETPGLDGAYLPGLSAWVTP